MKDKLIIALTALQLDIASVDTTEERCAKSLSKIFDKLDLAIKAAESGEMLEAMEILRKSEHGC